MVRTLLQAPPMPALIDGNSPGNLLALPQTLRALATIHYLLDSIESQLRVAEGGKGGLLVVSVTGPFYALLNVVRALIDVSATTPNTGEVVMPSE